MDYLKTIVKNVIKGSQLVLYGQDSLYTSYVRMLQPAVDIFSHHGVISSLHVVHSSLLNHQQ